MLLASRNIVTTPMFTLSWPTFAVYFLFFKVFWSGHDLFWSNVEQVLIVHGFCSGLIFKKVTEYGPSVPNLKTILISKWHLIENQPLLRESYKDPPLLLYRKGRFLENVLVRAKLWRSKFSQLCWPTGVMFGLSTIWIIADWTNLFMAARLQRGP